jgi:hypothetical protein
VASAANPWAALDPNSQHQLWSEWTFTVYEGGRKMPQTDVQANAARWLRAGFGSVGTARVTKKVFTVDAGGPRPFAQDSWVIEARVEGPPAHDPTYVASVRRMFNAFVAKGWGPMAVGTLTVRVLAGDQQDGQPRSQVIVMDGPLLGPGGLL